MRTEDVPKPLLQVGPRRLVEHQIEMLSAAGIGPVGMVLGYQSDEIVDVVGSQAEYIYNHRWATTNSLCSFLQAEAWVDSDLVLMNCDLLLHPRILDKLLAAGGDAFAYDSTSGNGLEHMKVRLEKGLLREMSKQLPADAVSGENVGVLHFKVETARRLFEIARELVDAGHANDWVGTAVQRLAEERPLKAVDVAGLKWVEIDFAYDLVKARKEVWPAIRKPGLTHRQFTGGVAAAAMVITAMVIALTSWATSEPPEVDWDTLTLRGSDRVMVSNGKRTQRWYQLGPADTAYIRVAGPDTLRVESRAIMPSTAPGPTACLLHFNLDGQAYEWIETPAKPSRSVRLDSLVVSKRVREHVPIPTGIHEASLFVESSLSATCLVRLRQRDHDMEDEV